MSATPKVVRGIVNLEMGGRYPYVSFQAGAIPVGKRVVILPAADFDDMVTRLKRAKELLANLTIYHPRWCVCSYCAWLAEDAKGGGE